MLGLPLAQARERLAAAGATEVREVTTAPPRRPLQTGIMRVVQQREANGAVVLVIALFPVLQIASAIGA